VLHLRTHKKQTDTLRTKVNILQHNKQGAKQFFLLVKPRK